VKRGITIALIAAAAVEAYRFINISGANGKMAGAGEGVIGASDLPAKVGERFDAMVTGIAEVQLGGTVSANDPLKSDANGKAVVGNIATDRIGGIALESGVAGDVIQVLLAQR